MSDPASQTNIKRRRGSKHDKTGCLTCRYRRKKCVQNTFPVCGACLRLNLQCIREPKRRVLPPSQEAVNETSSESKRKALFTPQVPDVPLDRQPARPQTDAKSVKRRHAMRYYVTVLAELLTVSRRYNSFISAFLPMAMESPALCDALVAWASGHLSTIDHSYSVTALEARSNALCALAKSISSGPSYVFCHETNTATCLVLLTSEVCLGNWASWYEHLVGAKHIIMSTRAPEGTGEQVSHGPEALKKSPEGEWVLRNFAYHDILGSVTSGKKPLIGGSCLEGITNVVDTYLGVASEILILISEISNLDWMPSTVDHMTTSYKIYSEIEQKLQDWWCHTSTAPVLAAVAYAYRSSALIYLYRRMRSCLKLHDAFAHSSSASPNEMINTLNAKIQVAALSVLSHISNVPLNDTSESALLFPLFLAGGEVTCSSHIEMISMRLRLMHQKRPFQNIQRATAVLEEVWDRRRNSPNEAHDGDGDWEDIASCQLGGLLLT